MLTALPLAPQMPPALLPKLQRLVTEGSYRPARTPAPGSGSGPTPPPASSLEDLEGLPALRCAFCRIIMTASRQVPQLETACKVIKVGRTRLGIEVVAQPCISLCRLAWHWWTWRMRRPLEGRLTSRGKHTSKGEMRVRVVEEAPSWPAGLTHRH